MYLCVVVFSLSILLSSDLTLKKTFLITLPYILFFFGCTHNYEPVISSITADPNPVPAGGVVSLQCIAKDDDANPYIYITNAHTFDYTFNLSKEDIEDGDTASDNLKVFFIFKSDKKNKRWEVTDWDMFAKVEKYSDKKKTNERYSYAYDSFKFKELTNIDTGEKLDEVGIIKKIAKTKEFLITLEDEYTDINICRFQGKKWKRYIGKVLSDKYKSKDGELLN